MYKCKHFRIEELVPQWLFEEYKKKGQIYKLWLIFDKDVLYIADRLREDYGPMTCNNWLWGGNRTLSGFRPFDEKDTGASLSQHKFGRALDLIPKNIHPDEIRDDIINGRKVYMEKIQCLEMNISWLHFDMRNNKGNIVTFDPND